LVGRGWGREGREGSRGIGGGVDREGGGKRGCLYRS